MESQAPGPQGLDQVRNGLRLHHDSLPAERSQMAWMKRGRLRQGAYEVVGPLDALRRGHGRPLRAKTIPRRALPSGSAMRNENHDNGRSNPEESLQAILVAEFSRPGNQSRPWPGCLTARPEHHGEWSPARATLGRDPKAPQPCKGCIEARRMLLSQGWCHCALETQGSSFLATWARGWNLFGVP